MALGEVYVQYVQRERHLHAVHNLWITTPLDVVMVTSLVLKGDLCESHIY